MAEPPLFVGLVAHPVRWQLLGLLARSDRRVDEMVAATGHPQPLVSYHLGRLRAGGVVTSRRSAKDHRASYYHLDLDRCGGCLTDAAASLHPGLGLVAPTLPPEPLGRRRPKVRVLFVCTGNSARSQIAEALMREIGDTSFDVASGGSDPKPIHALAVKALARQGIDISTWRSKPLTAFTGQRFEFVVTLCDKVREVCPQFTGGDRIHWSVEDPTSAARVDLARFQRLTDDLATRIRWLTWRIRTDQTTGDRHHAH